MRLIQADDYNDVVDIFISGAAAVDEIAPGVVRVTYFVEKVEIDGDARSRRRKIVDSQIWSVPQLADTLLVMQKALKEMRAMRGQPKLVQARGDALSDTGLAGRTGFFWTLQTMQWGQQGKPQVQPRRLC